MKTTVKSPYQPLGDRIVAKALDAETKTKSGIFLPETVADRAKPELADVLAVGQDVEEIKVGDRIVYEKYGPNKIKQNGEEFLILHEEDCLATVIDDPNIEAAANQSAAERNAKAKEEVAARRKKIYGSEA